MNSSKNQIKAINLVRKAIQRGDLEPITKETKCVDCGLTANYYEHRDYLKPLEVVPVYENSISTS